MYLYGISKPERNIYFKYREKLYHDYINYFEYWANANSVFTRLIFSAIIKGELHYGSMIFPS